MINIYEQKNTYKLLLLLVLLLIIITSILYTNYLAHKLSLEERKKMELLADTYKRLNNATGNEDVFLLRVGHDEIAVQIRDLDSVAGLECLQRFLERAAMLRREASGDHHMAFVRSGGDSEPAVGATIIGGFVVKNIMQELSGLPNEWLFWFENE